MEGTWQSIIKIGFLGSLFLIVLLSLIAVIVEKLGGKK